MTTTDVELFPDVNRADAEASEPAESAETHDVTIRIRYTVDPGETPPDEDEWRFRLRLAGVGARKVSVLFPSRKIR